MALYPNARAYLQAVYDHYRSLESYCDSGISRSLGRKHPRLCSFNTKFRRPSLFRFAFERSHPNARRRHLLTTCVVGHDGTAPYFYAKHYSAPAEVERPESLDMALAGATGISSGTAHTIGALLFKEVSGFNLLDLRRIRFRPHKVVLGVPCVCVSGIHPRGGRYTAWFGAGDMLLRRLFRSNFNSEKLRYNPSGACAIDPEVFHAPSVET